MNEDTKEMFSQKIFAKEQEHFYDGIYCGVNETIGYDVIRETPVFNNPKSLFKVEHDNRHISVTELCKHVNSHFYTYCKDTLGIDKNTVNEMLIAQGTAIHAVAGYATEFSASVFTHELGGQGAVTFNADSHVAGMRVSGLISDGMPGPKETIHVEINLKPVSNGGYDDESWDAFNSRNIGAYRDFLIRK